MLMHSDDDTIAAVATAMGDAGIGIVRLSGVDAFNIAEKIFCSASGKILHEMAGHTMSYGHIFHPKTREIIDEVLVSVMKAPHTYTTQDVVEINSHGGGVVIRAILEVVLSAGARMAEPGEFTKRAFLGGRIDLTQAEAVMDVIGAKSEKGLSLSLGQLRGGLKDKMDEIDHRFIDLLSDIEANIDYPEYDIEEVSLANTKKVLNEMIAVMDQLLSTLKTSRVFKTGIPTAIVGAPNVGKSSLLNQLLQTDKAIVTEIPGTTRDVIEDDLVIDGVPFKLIDTAGIRETADVVEKIGVARTLETIEAAALILFLVDMSREMTCEEKELLDSLKDRSFMLIGNKSDLPMCDHLNLPESALRVSMKTGDGLEALKKEMVKAALGKEMQGDESIVIANARQGACIAAAKEKTKSALAAIEAGMPLELISIDIQEALSEIRRVTGKEIGDDIVDEIFSKFCLGK